MYCNRRSCRPLSLQPTLAHSDALRPNDSYPAAGLRAGAEHFFVFTAVVLAETLCAGAMGLFISSMARWKTDCGDDIEREGKGERVCLPK